MEREPKFIQRSFDGALTGSIGSVLYSLLIYLLPTFNGIVKTH